MRLSQHDLRNLTQLAIKAATQAGLYIRSQVDQSYFIHGKTGGDSLASQVVTEVDLESQEIILSNLRASKETYDLGLLTEESFDENSRITKDYFWCIDPLDGTLPFTERLPGYAVSIALISKAGDAVIGAVYVPNEQVCYAAIKGEGVQINDQTFDRSSITSDNQLHWYMDRSFQTTSYFDVVQAKMRTYAHERNLDLQIHSTSGAVANATGVMTSGNGCYFKFPKKNEGGGSIWDYAATRLLFEELSLKVTNSVGDRLHLNNPETTFMNDQGIIYATDEALADFLVEMRKAI